MHKCITKSELGLVLVTISLLSLVGISITETVPRLSYAQTTDPYLNGLFDQSDNLMSDIGQSFAGSQHREVQDQTYNPPSSDRELMQICLDQSSQWSNNPQSYCNSTIHGSVGCDSLNLTIEECYANNFVNYNIVPKNVQDSIISKYDTNIASSKARTGQMEILGETLYNPDTGIYGKDWSDSFCMPYCN